MAIIGKVLKGTTKYASKLSRDIYGKGRVLQEKQLKKLLQKAKHTDIGKKYDFTKILKSDNPMDSYRKVVPVFDYNKIFAEYWHKTVEGQINVTWPGKITNFALTSGTTGAASKRVPVSKSALNSIKKTSIRQMLSLSNVDLPADFFEREMLFLGGSTQLKKFHDQYEGDLSGITTGNVPKWLSKFTKPEMEIRALEDWNDKIEEIVKNAPNWDLGVICGVPAWIQIMIDRILEHYNLESIFQVWPNLKIYVHGGVNFEPYRLRLNELFDEKVIYLDTYLCSEGFFAFQPAGGDSLQLLLKNGVYYEFLPFDEDHFDASGNVINHEGALTIDEVKKDVDYALLVSTNAGIWRYLIGDTIRFKDTDVYKIKITGRTKHFLSFCGEHLSVDNMTEGLTNIAFQHGLEITEFAVIGEHLENGNFGHRWFVSCDKEIDEATFMKELDQELCKLNADYTTERRFALEEVHLHAIPTEVFYDFMKKKGKYGSQHKFPRVLKDSLADEWLEHVKGLI